MDTKQDTPQAQHVSPAEAVAGTNRPPKLNLAIATLLVIVIALGAALVYFLILENEEQTEQAYVAGHLVQVTSQVDGTVRKVMADDTDVVKKGDVLISLDDSDFQLAYDRAQNELIQAIRQNKQQTAGNAQVKAEVLLRKAELAKAQADLGRRESLAGTDAISGEELSHARAAVVQAQAALKAVEAQEAAARAALGSNIPLRQQPAVQTAVSHIKDAWLNLQRTQIRSPIAGQTARRNVQVGQRIRQGTALMAVVPLDNLWVEAHFREPQLRKMKIGQPVQMVAGLYGDKVVYHGKVMGLSAGTGNVLSSPAAENTGADLKKTEPRVPVRISLDEKELAANPLRVGLSMTVTVDVSAAASGKTMTEAAEKNTALPEAGTVDWTAADALIEQIFEKYAK